MVLTHGCGPRRTVPYKSMGGGWEHAQKDSSCPSNPPTTFDLISMGAEVTEVPQPLHLAQKVWSSY